MNGRLRFVGVGVVFLIVARLAPGTLAQPLGNPVGSVPRPEPGAVTSDLPPDVPEWGIGAPIAYVVPPWVFNNRFNAQHNFHDSYLIKSAGTAAYFDAAVDLPSGALVEGVTPFYYDADASADVWLLFTKWTGTTSTGLTSTQLLSDTSSGGGGYQGGYHALAAPDTVRNVDPATGETNMYWLAVNVNPSGAAENLSFGGVILWYRLQITPAPASATFSDVPTSYWAFRHIEALGASGITTGCGGGNYCPESSVTRAEMAVFLAKALGLHWADGSAP